MQYFGDGTLSTFMSAIDAVKCAMEMQIAFQKEPMIPVRIGIHLGDIVITDEEIIGDGVNVASRIESLSVPGSVFISDKVYDEIKNHSSIEAQSLKTFELKNVDKPMEVFAISNKGLVIPDADKIEGKTKVGKEVSKATEKEKTVKKIRKKYAWIFFALIAILVIGGGYIVYKNISGVEDQVDALDKSIAVLAFENMSGDPNQEYFSDGISEEILNSLVKVEGLQVAGRTSSFSFKGKDTDILTIGKELGVGMVLEGSVRKSENRVRITAQLINAVNGFHLWSEQYDRELKDIFIIQEEIAKNIVDELKLTLLTPEDKHRPTDNVEAYDLYLKGIYALMQDVEGTVKGRNYFLKAINLDPDFALAYAGLGDAYLNYASYGIIPQSEAYSEAKVAAEKSISLDSNQAYGHKVLAYVHLFFIWDWNTALEEYNIAVKLGLADPDHFITWYNAFLYEDYEKAVRDAQTIVNRDPLSVEARWHLGACYLMNDQYEDAINMFEHTLEMDSNYSEGYRWLGKTYGLMGNYDEALHLFGQALLMTMGKGPALYETIIVLARSGRKEEANSMLNEMLNPGPDEYVPPIALAGVYANLGEFDEAFHYLDMCFEERTMGLVGIRALSDFDILRDDARYQKLVERMNFPK